MKSNKFILISSLMAVSCSECEVVVKDDLGVDDSLNTSTPNILFILVDDMGIDALNGYSQAKTAQVARASTPNIDRLSEQGITFDNVWANPLSSPTRAAVITGKYGHKTGILSLNSELSTDETTLHAAFPQEYSTSLIGKWHLTPDSINPETYGIDYFAGMTPSIGCVDDYYSWSLTQGDTKSLCNEYITTKITDLAIEWIGKQSKPWFCWYATPAPHAPYHLPPSYMHSQGDLPNDEASIEANPLPYFLAMIESVDYEIGRLLDSMDEVTRENTIVIIMGDNGTSRRVIQAPYTSNRSKGTLYEGGIRVPLIVSGAGVVAGNSRSYALISATDIFATIIELSGREMKSYEDSYSFADIIKGRGTTEREYSFSEVEVNGNAYANAIRNRDYKLFTQGGTPIGFYKIVGYTEGPNLLDTQLSAEESAAFDELTKALETIK